MHIRIEVLGNITAVFLAGEVNSRTTGRVEEALLPLVTPGCKLLLDMQNVVYMSSAGLRMLLLLHREVENKAGQIVLVGLQEMIRDTMAITGFLDFFQDCETVEEGLEFLKAHETN